MLPNLPRTALAFLMVVVAALGAGVAYWIALTEQESARLTRQLTRAQMVEISLRQAIVGDWGLRATLEERQRAHRARAANLQDTAERVRNADAQQAAQLDMLAQQELMLARLAGTLLTPFRSVPTGDSTEARIESVVSDELSRLGFSTNIEASPARQPSADRSAFSFENGVDARLLPAWRPIREAIHGLHHHVPWLALGVVFFILALVFFTLADLMRHTPRIGRYAVLAGIVSSAGALVSVLLFDISTWKPALFVLVASGAIAGVFHLAGLFDVHSEGETPHPPELEPEGFRGGHLSLKLAHGTRERVVTMMIAMAVLLSSVVAWWFADAQTNADAASKRAFETEVALTNLNGERWLDATTDSVIPALELFSARMRCSFATQAAALPPGDVGPTAMAMLARDRERDCQALGTDKNLQAAAKLVDEQANFDSADSPARKVFTERRNQGHNPSHLYALADGYISLAEGWERKSAMFVLGLTLFAIALYLLSQSLAMGNSPAALVLGACGTLLALGSFLHAGSVASAPVEQRGKRPEACAAEGSSVEQAARFYGDARAVFESATTGADYEKAADLFGCALAVRPEFGRAQYDRSRADALIGQGDVDSTYTNFPTKSRIGQIRESYRQTAASLEAAGWTPTPRFLNSQGFNTLLAGFAAGDLAVVNDGTSILQAGIASLGLTSPDGTLDAVKVANAPPSTLDVARMLYTNRGLGELARGDVEAAAVSYRAAVDALKLGENRPLVASSLSDLNILDGHCDAMHRGDAPRCVDIRRGIVGARGMLLLGKSAPPPNRQAVNVGNIRTWVRPSRVGWSGEVSGFDAARDVLSVVWLAYSSDWNVWRVVQPLFKTVDAKALAEGGRMNRVIVYDNSPSHCLPPGKYRAEFYLNGAKIQGGDAGVDVAGLKDYRSRELDVAFCAPEGWTLSPFRQNDEGRHLVRAFTNAQGRSALYLFTFFAPKTAGNVQTRQPIERAWTLLKRLTPSPPSDDQFWSAVDRFAGCGNPIPANTVLQRQWTDPDGRFHVALLVGNSAPDGQACDVLESIGGYYDRRVVQLLGQQ